MKLQVIYEGTYFECHMIKNLLEQEGIESSLHDEITGSRGGDIWRPAGGVKIVVSDEHYDKALTVVKAYVASISR